MQEKDSNPSGALITVNISKVIESKIRKNYILIYNISIVKVTLCFQTYFLD